MLTQEQIAKFQQLYSKRFGRHLSDQEAREKGEKVLRLMQLVYKPISKEQLKALQQRDKGL